MELSSDLQNIRRALDSSAIVATTDPNGLIKYVNSRFIEVSKYSSEELVGKNHRIINSGHHSPEFFADMWKTIRSGKKWEGDIKNRAKDGTFYWVHTIIVPFMDSSGKIQEFVSIRWEITDKKMAEQNLIETTKNLQNMLDASFEGLLVYDLSGRIRWCNSTAENIFQRSQTFIVSSHAEDFLGNQYKPFSEDLQLLSVMIEGQSHVLEVATKPYFHQQHRAYIATFRDVTEKSRMESQIIQQDRLASVGILASGLAHEIGTPLGIMRGRAEMISMIADAPASAVSGSQIIMQQIDRITHLIQNLLKLARGSKEEAPKAVHTLSLLADVEDFLKYELKKEHITLSIEVPDSFELLGVYNSLFQVTLNLLVNATHAIQQRRKTEKDLTGHIKVWAETQGNYNILHFEDNGCGMSDETMKNLFTPFYTTKEVGKGTGLGLATSYKILQSWGGFLSVSSTENQGSNFSVHVPQPMP